MAVNICHFLYQLKRGVDMYENDIPLSDKNSNFLQNFLEILEKETCDETVEIIRINFGADT